MLRQVGAKQADEPEDGEHAHRGKKKLGVVKEREGLESISS